jgi:hypothetical protein
MNFSDPALPQLPPELEVLIRKTLSNSEQIANGANPLELADKAIQQKLQLSRIIPSPFVIAMIILCILIHIGINIYTEYRVSKKHELQVDDYTSIGKNILRYCWNFKSLRVSMIRDDVETIYEKYLGNGAKKVLSERCKEIKEHQLQEKISGLIKIHSFILFITFLLIIGLGGIYIGFYYEGCVLMIVTLLIARKLVPFIFPYKIDSYEYLQYKHMRSLVEKYELEVIEQLKKRL